MIGIAVDVVGAPQAAAATCGAVVVAGPSWLGGGGADVHSNGAQQGTGVNCGSNNATNPAVQDGNAWQCVELAARLYFIRGWGNVHAGGNGGAAYIPGGSPNLAFHPNGSGYVPVPGDLVIFSATSSNAFGHVAVVDSVAGGIINDVEQNASANGHGSLTISGSTISGGVRGVEHSPKNLGAGGSGARSELTSDGHIQLFMVAGGAVRQTWYDAGNGALGGWASSAPLGAQAVGIPATVQRAGQSVIDIFVRAADGNIYETWYNWGNGAWGGWAGLGGAPITSDPQTVATNDGHEQVFATANGLIKQSWWSPANGAIGGWRAF